VGRKRNEIRSSIGNSVYDLLRRLFMVFVPKPWLYAKLKDFKKLLKLLSLPSEYYKIGRACD
jgi:hypothetical protein